MLLQFVVSVIETPMVFEYTIIKTMLIVQCTLATLTNMTISPHNGKYVPFLF